jgi:hypothetical protein
MTRFKVPVRGDRLEKALQALEAAGTPELSGYVGASDPTRPSELVADVDADDARGAEATVEEIVGADYEIGPAEAVNRN